MNRSFFNPSAHHPIRHQRIEAGLSLRDMARKVGVNHAHLCRMERGERKVSEGVEAKVTKAVARKKKA